MAVTKLIVYIQHKQTEQVLDIKGGDPEPGVSVILYPYYATSNQHWQFKEGRIVSEMSGLVLDVDQGTGQLVMTEDCGAPSQLWALDDSGALKNGDGRFITAVAPAQDSEDGLHTLAASPERCDTPDQEFAILPAETS